MHVETEEFFLLCILAIA